MKNIEYGSNAKEQVAYLWVVSSRQLAFLKHEKANTADRLKGSGLWASVDIRWTGNGCD